MCLYVVLTQRHGGSFAQSAGNASTGVALKEAMYATLYIMSTVTLVTFMFGITTVALIFYNNRKG